ncbi:hypothetical protein [Actinomadura opuntiae]|uniref:hypothetical protein n=1 Tax=Actinomadura sp. OS1-43 TaxID=604315 RepID=UPI00255ABCE5|nr:hypothetical protein [Actinomadura sp. OS1-43]
MISIRRKPQDEMLTRLGRVQEAARQGAERCQEGASVMAERIMPAAQEQLMVARGWSAPRLRMAAQYVENGLAPRVSSFLGDVAQRVEPPAASKPRRGAIMAMMGVVAAAGMAGVVLTKRDAVRDMAKGSGEQGEAVSADSMTVSGSDVDGQVHSPH